MAIRIELPDKFRPLLEPYRYKIAYGGRGAARSWSFARALVGRAYERPMRVACLREYMSNIKESVHQVLKSQISLLGLESSFRITETGIQSSVGSEFIFKGIVQDPIGVKSMEGIDVAWLEEGQAATKTSLEILRPTIRKPGSEIWISMNTGDEEDPVYKELIAKPPPNSWVQLLTYRDNPFFPIELEAERLDLESKDEDAYLNVWEGQPRRITNAQVMRGRYKVHEFKTPGEDYGEPTEMPRFYFGLDFGFAEDPLALVRFWITGDPPDDELWIDYELVGHRVEFHELERFMERMPRVRGGWPIRADAARPETISFLSHCGFSCSAAEKWNGSVEDGLAHIKGYKIIHIHPRCVNTILEMRLYSYKVDRKTGDILPVLVDKHNHCIDALRYGHDGLIQRRGGVGLWARLGRQA